MTTAWIGSLPAMWSLISTSRRRQPASCPMIERFRDEIGDWRVCILTPFGTPVHAPWAMAIERRLMERYDIPIETMWADDGIVLRLPESADTVPPAALIIDPCDVDGLVVTSLPQRTLYWADFRPCAGRGLL